MGFHPGYPKPWPVQVSCPKEDLATSRAPTLAFLLLLEHTNQPPGLQALAPALPPAGMPSSALGSFLPAQAHA